ncbi:MAG: protein kinase [Polyangiaceae bacterium]|nr:protein kinase [Polyangiaceae bacterium]
MTQVAPETSDGTPLQGDLIAGRYRVERVLGEGGMGVVVAAVDQTLNQTVAVKLLLPEAMQREDAVERFLREGRAAVQISSEHIARVLDVGTAESGRPYIAMEYLVGKDLGDTLQERGPLPISEAVDYVLQAALAIAEAHAKGIIHRDLKPPNIFVTRRGNGVPFVKVLDFGLSKIVRPDALEPALTTANAVMGSPYYMSPEQVRSHRTIDARTDIWSLGVILYELVTGRRPFEEQGLGGLFVQIGAEPHPPIHTRVPGAPAEFEAAVDKCLEKAPDNRFQTVPELVRALLPFAPESTRVHIEKALGSEAIAGAPPSGAGAPPSGAGAPPSGVGLPSPGGVPVRVATPEGGSHRVSAPPADPDAPRIRIVPPGPTAIVPGRPSNPPSSVRTVEGAPLSQPSRPSAAELERLAETKRGSAIESPKSYLAVYILAAVLALIAGAAIMLLVMK